MAPSATGSGLVIATFETRLPPGQIQVATGDVLTEELYRRLRS